MREIHRTPFAVPAVVHNFLERYNWGDYHSVYHLARRYYVVGAVSRKWMQQNGEKPSDLQEGDPMNGLDFLSMHRAMIKRLNILFGNARVTNDPEGFQRFGQVLRGWTSDQAVINGLRKMGKDYRTFQRGLANVNNFAQFKSDDEFGLFVQTAARLTTLNERNPAKRHYDTDQRPGAGVHNWLHGQHQNGQSPINIGQPRTNLPNILFWRIHGWIEAKWRQFEASRQRSASQQQWYNRFATKYTKHMHDMSKGFNPKIGVVAAPRTGAVRALAGAVAAANRRVRSRSTGRSLSSFDTGRQLQGMRKPRTGKSHHQKMDPAHKKKVTGGKRKVVSHNSKAVKKRATSRWRPEMHGRKSVLRKQILPQAANVVNNHRKLILVPPRVLADAYNAMFNDRVQCWRYAVGTTSTLCPNGQNSDPRVRLEVPRPGDRRPLHPYDTPVDNQTINI